MKSYRLGCCASWGSRSNTLAATHSITSESPLRRAFSLAHATANSDTSTAVTCLAPPRAAFRAKEPVWVKQSSTVRPRASLATACRLYF